MLRVSSFAGVSRLAAALVLGLTVSACETLESINPLNAFADKGPKSDIGPDQPAEVLFNDGLARMEKKQYEQAAKKFAELDKQYPYSNWSRKALVLSTFANYEAGEYDDAIASGRRFVQLYPADPDAAYAQYLVGMSYFNQIPDITRDQERAEKALIALDEVVRKWPRSEYAGDAKRRVQVARDQLAGKEMEVGRYYLTRRNYSGAVNRFREVLVRYQTTRHVEEALMRLSEAYMALGIVPEAQTAAAVLGHNFPDSPWYKDAFKLLESGGVGPRENTDSWISKLFKGFQRSVGL
ncbi:MAG TPA: outer membrane protein assembly factor BamD [Beijerinckiaceae bacterium]|nr:outer membrane protein assembly factor BamD [Beijerinckiaceae bacterium]